jgi:hypothetical protein
MDLDGEEDWQIFSITEDLNVANVDANKLILSSTDNEPALPIGMSNFRSKVPVKHIRINEQVRNIENKKRIRMKWKIAALKLRNSKCDLFSDFNIDIYPAENVIRHRYNAIRKVWLKDECVIKIERNQFANGAMRACYRL